VVASRGRVAETAAAAWTEATGMVAEPDTRIGYGPDPGTLLVRARILSHVPDGPASTSALATHLERDGWRLERSGGGGQRFGGRRDDLTVRASYADASGALLLEITTDPVLVGTARVRELVRQ
jgi:hypothetical protein